MRRRLDLEMVRRGLVASRTEAAAAIASGNVTVAGRPAGKPSTLVARDEAINLDGPARRFVSRGGEKLEAALDRFAIDVTGRRALDAGSSTGGFVDCLLQRGARHVLAVDVGYGQLDWRLRQDERVTLLERANVRDLRPEALPYIADLTTADLSFISLRLAIPALRRCSSDGADFVLLVKPQFEAGRGRVGNGGVVRDPAVWTDVLQGVAEACRSETLTPLNVVPSPLTGPAGNVEFLLHARPSAGDTETPPFDEAIERSIQEAAGLAATHA
ncbi:MAG TPA: TlyA family RNA methyltransferase [Actinomycetota bacterium]